MTMTTQSQTSETMTPPWCGINHLALITPDMDATVRFYHGTLGARLVATIGNAEFRHYFFEFGPKCTVAFFEYAEAKPASFVKAAGVADPRALHFDHLALNLPDEEALLGLRRRLKAADCEVTDVIDHGGVRSVYFTDPNGIALEASWWVLDPTQGDVDYKNGQVFADPRPVPAVEELGLMGKVSSVPSTRLG